jgi:hypothetical protein
LIGTMLSCMNVACIRHRLMVEIWWMRNILRGQRLCGQIYTFLSSTSAHLHHEHRNNDLWNTHFTKVCHDRECCHTMHDLKNGQKRKTLKSDHLFTQTWEVWRRFWVSSLASGFPINFVFNSTPMHVVCLQNPFHG